MQRRMETSDLPDLLYRNLDHPRWDQVAERCLSCANCTLVCPTCFCHDEKDEPAPDGRGSLRVREWDSCFNREHAQVHGHNFRPQIAHRYRQWLVHKLAAWIDQFGSSGCTGCGRCITWCPVGIDLTEEVAAIRATSGTRSGEPPG
jgi:ferredoxin